MADAARSAVERAARDSYGRLVAILAARWRDLAAAEDAVSDALAAALRDWPDRGVPAHPDAWLMAVARNRLSNAARNAQGRAAILADPVLAAPEGDADPPAVPDARLALMFVCAHPAIDPAARAPLMLQTVLGLDAARIAAAFVVPPATLSQRLVRAKARIRDAGLRFAPPAAADLGDRLGDVLDAVYGAFGRGWDELEPQADPAALTAEAIWLARLLVQLLPAEPEPKGLLALMLYCAARQGARRDAAGRFVPLDRQDTGLWDRSMVIEAEGLLTDAARAGRFGRYQCEAAIQSLHVFRAATGRSDPGALLALYDLLIALAPSLGARVGRAGALLAAGQADRALDELAALPADRVAGHQPYHVVQARALAAAGRADAAAQAQARAIALTPDPAVRAWLAPGPAAG